MEINSKIEFILTDKEVKALDTVRNILTDIDGAVSEYKDTIYYHNASDVLSDIIYDTHYSGTDDDGKSKYILEVEL